MVSRPEIPCPKTVMNGFVSLTIHARLHSSRMRVTSARLKPSCRALPCCSLGNFPARIEMKTMLSMPKIISSTVNVTRLIQICGSLSHSIRRTLYDYLNEVQFIKGSGDYNHPHSKNL